MSQKNVNAWVIDNDMDARMRLKQATNSVPRFKNVKLLNGLEEAIRMIESAEHIDIIFIAHRFPQGETTSFIAKAKDKNGGRDSAYVLVLKTDDQDSETVAKNVLVGADGFLLEPYSVDNLVEITELAERVKQERSLEREQAALKFLIQDVMKQIDRVAYIKSCGFDVGRNLKKLKEMCAVFQDLQNESKEIYLELAVSLFGDAPLPDFQVKNYKGVSERVRKRMEAKVIAEMEAQAEADAAKRPNSS